MVAEQLLLGGVEGEGSLAAGAGERLAAVAAEDVGGGATAVEEQDGLMAGLQRLVQCTCQRPAEERAVSGAQFQAHVDHAHRRQVDGFGLRLLPAGSEG